MKDDKRCPDDLKKRYGKHWPELFELGEQSYHRWRKLVKLKQFDKRQLAKMEHVV